MSTARLETFSDGVIAIIITIRVLELKVPHGGSLSDLARYREEGGRIQWLCLSPGRWYDEPHRVAEAARWGPIGIAPHGGGIGDRCLRENSAGSVRNGSTW